MTLHDFVLDAVAKTPSPLVYGEICDLVVASVEKQGGSKEAANMAAEIYLIKIREKFPELKNRFQLWSVTSVRENRGCSF